MERHSLTGEKSLLWNWGQDERYLVAGALVSVPEIPQISHEAKEAGVRLTRARDMDLGNPAV